MNCCVDQQNWQITNSIGLAVDRAVGGNECLSRVDQQVVPNEVHLRIKIGTQQTQDSRRLRALPVGGSEVLLDLQQPEQLG